ncbi:hypothetical protein JG688_00009115 [Phytophthora aleatoria]|uniref:Uncharacterized protein n=1 Tax=Phytophthora aleatoria TaxID=2496075 RepID=A0A8J5IGR8_9STRA|nr:hypothetical protein JG688_00009115 [Phytophthora aleatoria]
MRIMERYSAPCTTVCTSTTNDAVKLACDTGAQAYCSSANTILSDQCRDYTNRVIGTKNNSAFAGKVLLASNSSKTTVDYYNALSDAGLTAIQGTIVNNPTLDHPLMQDSAFKSKVGRSVMTTCAATSGNNPNCGNSIPWMYDYVTSQAAVFATSLQGLTGIAIATTFVANKDILARYNTFYEDSFRLFMLKLKISDLSDTNVRSARYISPNIALAIDLCIINAITGSWVIPFNSNGFTVDLAGRPTLYDADIRRFYQFINKSSSPFDANLNKVIAKADATNIEYCTAVMNATSDPLCIAMKATNEPALVTAVDAAIARYTSCKLDTNFVNEECIKQTKLALSDPTTTADTKAKIYRAVLTTATKNNVIDTSFVNQFSGMVDWLKLMTVDTISTTAAGVKVVTSSCGTKTGLSVEECNRICAAYPDTCLKDQLQRCELPGYRYSDKEGFVNYSRELNWRVLTVIVVLIVLIMCGSVTYAVMHNGNQSEKNDSTRFINLV